MLESLRNKINDTIDEKQNIKEELYDKISHIDNELLELNEILFKINEEDAFLKISPYEAFGILEILGYTDDKEKYELYFKLVSNRDNIGIKEETVNNNSLENKIVINNYNSYEEKIEKCKKELTKEQRILLGNVVEVLIDSFYGDDFYYYVSGIKISKFRVYYNLSILLTDNYQKEEIYDMIKTAFTYQTMINDNKEKVLNGLEKVKDKIDALCK